ncbi:hypothetical protein OVS_00960 [Mycoplasma ovis str. Michigan]|uniref:Uncharacterized protein n=1 Tax=Mycoplasma ovis str. Michigan TaxID=1415773 RepID=A0ABM5P123_9MOLU|nr:hypothetical protein [Mycoplasma ovis]AHC40166.1 hypothetical protein OVS_00960 [Mycoplasma ovis str. Michigan]
MPEEILDTRKEQVKEVQEEKGGPVQQFLKKVFDNKFFSPFRGAIAKVKDSRAKSVAKKEEAKKAKNKASNAKEKK